jgi:hypothetical protein
MVYPGEQKDKKILDHELHELDEKVKRLFDHELHELNEFLREKKAKRFLDHELHELNEFLEKKVLVSGKESLDFSYCFSVFLFV